MTASATLFASLALAAATAVGTVYVLRPAASADAPSPAIDAAIAARLDAIAARLDAIEERTATVVEPAALRTATGPSRAEIEGWIADALAQRRAGTESVVEAAADAEFRVDDAVAQLAAAGSQSPAGQQLWERARAAGKVKELVAAFERRATENPASAAAQFDLGSAYVQAIVGATDILSQSTFGQKADKAFDAALALDDTHWGARYSKAVGLTFWPDFLGKKAEAIRHFEILATQQEGAAARPEFAETWVTLGNLYEQQGKDEEARRTWERGLAQFPDEPRLRGKLQR